MDNYKHKIVISKSQNRIQIQGVVLAFIINSNCFKIVFSFIPGMELITMLLCCLFIVLTFRSHLVIKKGVLNYSILIIVVWTLITGIINENLFVYGNVYLKFVLGISVATAVTTVSKDTLNQFIKTTIVINTIYALLIIVDRAYDIGMGDNIDANYLQWTLCLGFSVSILETLIIFSKENRVLHSMELLIQVYALLMFQARGSVLFPIIILITLILYMLVSYPGLFVRALPWIIAVVISGLYLISKIDVSALFLRLDRLFTNYENETRIVVWKDCIEYVCMQSDFIRGIGFKGFSNIVVYPHNLYLELAGELGIIGIVCMLTISICIIKYSLFLFRLLKISTDREYKQNCLSIIMGAFYFFMIFMKSYSVYDGFYLFILLGFICNCYYKCNKSALS